MKQETAMTESQKKHRRYILKLTREWFPDALHDGSRRAIDGVYDLLKAVPFRVLVKFYQNFGQGMEDRRLEFGGEVFNRKMKEFRSAC